MYVCVCVCVRASGWVCMYIIFNLRNPYTCSHNNVRGAVRTIYFTFDEHLCPTSSIIACRLTCNTKYLHVPSLWLGL